MGVRADPTLPRRAKAFRQPSNFYFSQVKHKLLHLVKVQILHRVEAREGKKFQQGRGSRKLSLGRGAGMTAFARDREDLKVFRCRREDISAGGEMKELGFAEGINP